MKTKCFTSLLLGFHLRNRQPPLGMANWASAQRSMEECIPPAPLSDPAISCSPSLLPSSPAPLVPLTSSPGKHPPPPWLPFFQRKQKNGAMSAHRDGRDVWGQAGGSEGACNGQKKWGLRHCAGRGDNVVAKMEDWQQVGGLGDGGGGEGLHSAARAASGCPEKHFQQSVANSGHNIGGNGLKMIPLVLLFGIAGAQ